jgi:hypothetical protein
MEESQGGKVILLAASAVRAKAAAKRAKRKAKAERIARALVCTTSDGHPVKLRSGIRHHKLEAKLQAELNRAIRARDYGKPCITCNRPVSEANANAGHCFPVGSHPSVRFHPLNIHLQCGNPCNRFNGGEGAIYAEEIKVRYGLSTYAMLFDLAQVPRRLSIPDIVHLRAVLAHDGLDAYQQRYFDLTGWPVERTKHD